MQMLPLLTQHALHAGPERFLKLSMQMRSLRSPNTTQGQSARPRSLLPTENLCFLRSPREPLPTSELVPGLYGSPRYPAPSCDRWQLPGYRTPRAPDSDSPGTGLPRTAWQYRDPVEPAGGPRSKPDRSGAAASLTAVEPLPRAAPCAAAAPEEPS